MFVEEPNSVPYLVDDYRKEATARAKSDGLRLAPHIGDTTNKGTASVEGSGFWERVGREVMKWSIRE